jgi:hypothetical protein
MVRHEVERRVKGSRRGFEGGTLQSASTLKPLSAYAEVLMLIATPHWLGVETPEGRRGWIPEERLVQLPRGKSGEERHKQFCW